MTLFHTISILVICLIVCVFGWVPFVGSYTTRQYVPPQSVGGGLMSQGGFQEVQHTYHAPHSIGAGMVHPGGWTHTPIIPEPPWRQVIIDVAAAFANGHSSNNYRRNLPP